MIRLDRLPGAMPNEKLFGLYRRHPITMFGVMAAFVVILILPLVGYFALYLLDSPVMQDPAAHAIMIMGGSIFFLFAMLFIYQQFLDYWLDMWIVTNRRIINIEQHGLFSRTVSELRLYRVQDVTAKVSGFVHSMLDFGMVYIQTAGEKEYFAFEEVPHPNEISRDVLRLAEKDRAEHLESAMEAIEETTLDQKHEITEKTAAHLEP